MQRNACSTPRLTFAEVPKSCASTEAAYWAVRDNVIILLHVCYFGRRHYLYVVQQPVLVQWWCVIMIQPTKWTNKDKSRGWHSLITEMFVIWYIQKYYIWKRFKYKFVSKYLCEGWSIMLKLIYSVKGNTRLWSSVFGLGPEAIQKSFILEDTIWICLPSVVISFQHG